MNNFDVQKILPVLTSIIVIVTIAILRNYSRAFAAVTATIPLNITLGLWIIYANADDRSVEMMEFSTSVLINIVPTLGFIGIAYFAARAGWLLVPTLLAGYAFWAAGIGIIVLIRGTS